MVLVFPERYFEDECARMLCTYSFVQLFTFKISGGAVLNKHRLMGQQAHQDLVCVCVIKLHTHTDTHNTCVFVQL